MRVSLVKDETVESLVRTLSEHLASWGGRPLLCVFDRPKTIALAWRRNGEVTEWNPVNAQLLRRLNLRRAAQSLVTSPVGLAHAPSG
jgi:hypothetical protein